MSAKEVIELCRILANLNYNGQLILVTPDSFSKPNINLVTNILDWFAKIVSNDDSPQLLSNSFDNKKLMSEQPEAYRITYLTAMGKYFRKKLGVHLNLVAIYRADDFSCRELLKIANLIHRASLLYVSEGICNEEDLIRIRNERESTIDKLKIMLSQDRESFISDINQMTIDLDGLIGDEEKFNDERLSVMDRQLELEQIESTLKSCHGEIKSKTDELIKSNQELKDDLTRLDEKLRIKELELARVKSNFNDSLLKNQSPDYLSRFNKLRKLYEYEYNEYISKYRNFKFLKSCVYGTVNSVDQAAEANPEGSIGSSRILLSELTADGAGAGGEAMAGLGALATGPARLAESLFDGASKPMSASLRAAGATTGLGAAVEAGPTGRTRAGAAGGTAETAGRRTTVDGRVYTGAGTRPAFAGDTAGTLELDGLLNEFAADGGERLVVDNEDADGEEEDDEDDDDDDEDGEPEETDTEDDDGDILDG